MRTIQVKDLTYFEIIDTVTEEMKHRFTESDAVLNALCAFCPHNLSLFSDELLNSLAEKYQSLLNVNEELKHSQIIVARTCSKIPIPYWKCTSNCLQCSALFQIY